MYDLLERDRTGTVVTVVMIAHVVQAYFCQPCLSAVCQGPLKKYPPITGQQMAESRYMELDWLKGHDAKAAAAKGIAGHKLPISVA